jgi:ATP-dependent NAD(P)H-hydrate dehydratase
MTNKHLIQQVKRIIPPLSGELHKGQAGELAGTAASPMIITASSLTPSINIPGRVGVVGGSKDYTGAPYFSSYTAMRLVSPSPRAEGCGEC